MSNSPNRIILIMIFFCVLSFISCSKQGAQSNIISTSDEKKAEEQFNVARSLSEKAEFGKAILEYQKVIISFPQLSCAPIAQFSIGRCYYDLKDFDNSKKVFQKFLKDFPRHELSTQAQVYLGDLFEQEKNYKSAINLYRQALKNYKGDKHFPEDKIQFRVALCYESLSDYNQAIREFLKLIRKYPKSKLVALSKFNVVYSYATLGKEDKAKECSKWVIEQHPGTSEAKLAQKLLNEINESNTIKRNK